MSFAFDYRYRFIWLKFLFPFFFAVFSFFVFFFPLQYSGERVRVLIVYIATCMVNKSKHTCAYNIYRISGRNSLSFGNFILWTSDFFMIGYLYGLPFQTSTQHVIQSNRIEWTNKEEEGEEEVKFTCIYIWNSDLMPHNFECYYFCRPKNANKSDTNHKLTARTYIHTHNTQGERVRERWYCCE